MASMLLILYDDLRAQFSALIMVRKPFVEWNEHANKHTNWSDYNYELKPVKMVKYAAFNGSLKIILIIIGATSERVDVGDDSSSSSSNDNNNSNNDSSSQSQCQKAKLKKKTPQKFIQRSFTHWQRSPVFLVILIAHRSENDAVGYEN